MTHEGIAVLTLLLSLVSAVGVLWIALRLASIGPLGAASPAPAGDLADPSAG